MDGIDFLVEHHRRLRDRVALVTEAFLDASPDPAPAFAELADDLIVHSALEEELLYPLLAQYEEEDVEHALDEHHRIEVAADELRNLAPDDPAWHPAFQRLCRQLFHHLAEEERELFITARRLIPAEELADLAQRLRAREDELFRELHDEWYLVVNGQQPASGG